MTKTQRLIPPDGGWGWVAVFGVSLVNIATRSIEPSFGLLFGDMFEQMGVATTGAAFVMSTMDAMINLSGFMVGPICRYLSFRKVSVLGSALNAIGLILTFQATSIGHILVTYSIIGGIGTGLASSATFVVLNHYFSKKRGQAVGLSLAGTALGMMIFPQLVTILLQEFGFRGAVLILGAVNLHSIVGSLLLQPAKWHMIPAPVQSAATIGNNLLEMEPIAEHDVEEYYDDFDSAIEIRIGKPDGSQAGLGDGRAPESEVMLPQMPKITNPLTNNKFSQPELYGFYHKTPKKNFSAIGLSSRFSTVPKNLSTASLSQYANSIRKRKASVISNLSAMDFTCSSIQLHASGALITSDESLNQHGYRKNMTSTSLKSFGDRYQMDGTVNTETKEALLKQSIWWKIYAFLDLDLLKDGIYLNLLLGLSLFYVAEQNFKMVTPFFFKSLGYTPADAAFCLSSTAVMDVVARVVLPPICDRLAPDVLRRKTIFMITSLFLAIGRLVLSTQTQWRYLLVWFTICGFLRGAVLINFTLTVSEWCPTLEKLPAAFGLQMVSKGIFVIALGPVLGWIRDETKSFQLCMIAQCILIFMSVFVWTVEYIYVYWFHPRRNRNEVKSDQIADN